VIETSPYIKETVGSLCANCREAKSIVSSHLRPITDSEIMAQVRGQEDQRRATTLELRRRLDSIIVSPVHPYRTVPEREQMPQRGCGIEDALIAALYESIFRSDLKITRETTLIVSSVSLEIYDKPLPHTPLCGLISVTPTRKELCEGYPGDLRSRWDGTITDLSGM